MKIKAVNSNIDSVTIQDIENHKIITDYELNRDLDNIIKRSKMYNYLLLRR